MTGVCPEKAQQLAEKMRCDVCPALKYCMNNANSIGLECAETLAAWLEGEEE